MLSSSYSIESSWAVCSMSVLLCESGIAASWLYDVGCEGLLVGVNLGSRIGFGSIGLLRL